MTKKRALKPPPIVMTVGHSTRTLESFISLLQAHGVKLIVDVRTVPRSRHNPRFNRDSLPESLAAVGIAYEHLPGLGGLRRPRRDSPNTGWRNAGFRGYADYMQTPEFDAALAALNKLIKHAERKHLALMCAEAVPWRCHRSLIADALLIRGIKVEHLMSPKSSHQHTLTPWAKADGIRLTYPPETLQMDFESAKE
jgi:uncharacterized protein (DUF488 family)